MPKLTSKTATKTRVSKTTNTSKFSLRSTRAKIVIILVIALVGVLVVNLIHAATLTPPASDSDKMIGLNGTYSVDKYVADAQSMGTKWIRVEQWGDAGSYDTVPNTLNRLSAQNIRMLPLVNNYNVSWVTAAGKQQWVDAIVHTATTYGKGGTYWQGRTDLGSTVIEVGNETYGQWYPWPDKGYLKPVDYATMVKQAAIAVNTATNGRVKLLLSCTTDYLDTNDLSGGSGGTWKSWSKVIKAGIPDIEQYIGGVVSHPYGDLPQVGIGTSTDPNWSHQSMYTIHGLWNVPVYVTEVGQKGPQVGFDKQAAAMSYYFDELKNNSWEAGLFWYSQKDYQAYDPNADNGWALIDMNDVHEPAWNIYQSKAQNFYPVASDSTPPAVTLTSPSNGSTVSGVINVGANASDNVSIAGVQFKVDNNNVGTEDSLTPFLTAFDTKTVSNGSHILTAVARDSAGNVTTSAQIAISVNNPVLADTTAPSVPASLFLSWKKSTSVSISWASSTDTGGSGLAGYKVFRNGVLVATTPNSTYMDSGLQRSTYYTYSVKAFDNAGNTSTASAGLRIKTARR
jgi:hypothetical protein